VQELTVNDFDKVRTLAFGLGRPAGTCRKMANSIDSNRDLQGTCQPGMAVVVQLADEARARGRLLMRATSGSEQK